MAILFAILVSLFSSTRANATVLVRFPADLTYKSLKTSEIEIKSLRKKIYGAAEQLHVYGTDPESLRPYINVDAFAASDNQQKVLMAIVGVEPREQLFNQLLVTKHNIWVYHTRIDRHSVVLVFSGFNTQDFNLLLGQIQHRRVSVQLVRRQFNFASLFQMIVGAPANAEQVAIPQFKTDLPNSFLMSAEDSTLTKAKKSLLSCGFRFVMTPADTLNPLIIAANNAMNCAMDPKCPLLPKKMTDSANAAASCVKDHSCFKQLLQNGSEPASNRPSWSQRASDKLASCTHQVEQCLEGGITRAKALLNASKEIAKSSIAGGKPFNPSNISEGGCKILALSLGAYVASAAAAADGVEGAAVSQQQAEQLLVAAEKKAAEDAASKEVQKSIEEKSADLIGKPYDHSLGEGPKGIVSSKPLMCMDQFDCTTYVESVTASALGKTPQQTETLLRQIRYEDGKVSFLKRNHFTELDWIPNNEKAGIYSDITSDIGEAQTQSVKATIDRGAWLKNDVNPSSVQRDIPPEQKAKIAAKINAAGDLYKPVDVNLNYISIDSLRNPALRARIPSGSVFNVVRDSTSWIIKGERKPVGTIVSHQGFIIRKNGELYLRHASSVANQVVDVPLDEYLTTMEQNPSIVGLNILRVNPVAQ